MLLQQHSNSPFRNSPFHPLEEEVERAFMRVWITLSGAVRKVRCCVIAE